MSQGILYCWLLMMHNYISKFEWLWKYLVFASYLENYGCKLLFDITLKIVFRVVIYSFPCILWNTLWNAPNVHSLTLTSKILTISSKLCMYKTECIKPVIFLSLWCHECKSSSRLYYLKRKRKVAHFFLMLLFSQQKAFDSCFYYQVATWLKLKWLKWIYNDLRWLKN